MKLFFNILTILFLTITNCFSQTTAIPDANFEQKLISLGIDTNGVTGNILNSDALAVTTLNLLNSSITNINGIEAFTNLVSLDLSENEIANISLTTLTLLETLKIEVNFVLTNLDVSQNVALKTFLIYGSGNSNSAFWTPLTTLNLASNINLEEISIRRLRNLTNLTLPITATLKKVRTEWLADPSLDFSSLNGLEELDMYYSQGATTITLPTVAPNFKIISIRNIDFFNINLSNYSNLQNVYLYVTNVQNIIFPTAPLLTNIHIEYHNLQSLVNLTTVPNLKDLVIKNNLTTPLLVNVTQNLVLETIDFSDNDMGVVDLTQNVLLRNLVINNNLLTSLNTTNNILLFVVNASNNLLTSAGLDLTQNVLLNEFRASFNQITSLNISQNAVLITLILDHNLFSGTAILDQFYSLRSNNDGIYGGTLNVSFNNLSGVIPNYTSLFHFGTPQPSSWTRFFRFYLNDNNFEFGHFENQHPSYISALTTFSTPPSVFPVMSTYNYAPQAKVNTIDTINATAGDPITLTTVVSGAQNHYKWFKNNAEIVGAPDSPNYVINSVNPCDQGVYYCEILSDLVPFENANPPGTNGKNLKLTRNNITLNVTPATNSCPTLTSPLNGALNVPINPTITWADSPNACSYSISIGTNSGGTEILNNVNVGDVNFYTLTSNLPINDEIFVTITPNYQSGPAPICTEQSFTTGTLVAVVPTCVTAMDYPAINATNIPVTQNFSWIPVANATDYTVTMTTSSGIPIAGTTNLVTNVFNPTADLPQGVPVYLTIVPSNSDGSAVGCSVFQFTVETIPNPPTCPTGYSISNGATNVSVNLGGISWASVSSQTIYNVSIGTTAGGTDFVNYFFNNTSEYFDLAGLTFAHNTTYHLTITVEDQSTGNTTVCSSISFTTENAPLVVPNCTTLVSPLSGSTNVEVNSNISWNTVSNATGYFISIGTTAGGTNFVNNFDNGNNTTYNPPSNFTLNTTYFVTITPYNLDGSAISCTSESFTSRVLPCTIMVSPQVNSTNVNVSVNISWAYIFNATGYIISIGTTAGGTDFLNNFDAGDTLTYNPPIDFAPNTTYHVSIIPYNLSGTAVGCNDNIFTTGTIVTIPTCTTLVSPSNGSLNIAVSSNISWNAVSNATGYLISIGTTSGGTDFVNNFDNGNSTTFNPPTDFAQNTQYFVTITPYNSVGNATSCASENFTTQTIINIPSCATNISPANNATNVLLNANITWNAVATATGYSILFNGINYDVGNTTTYNPPADFAQNTSYIIIVTPYNSAGNASGCSASEFTTQTLTTIPSCTNLVSPLNGSTNVAVNANISWNAVSNATVYSISIEDSIGTNFIQATLGNVLTYNPPTDFAQNTTYSVTITPLNNTGNAVGCTAQSFTTQTIITIPTCTTLVSPSSGSTNVAINANISWNAIASATGYFISIGTVAGGTNFVNNFDNGNSTTFNPTTDFAQNTTYFVTITPYNSAGNATSCASENFTTETILTIPNCTTLVSPTNGSSNVTVNSNISWNAIASATGYFISIGTTSGGTNFLNNFDNGNSTTFNPTTDFAQNTSYFVTITPYNSAGNATACASESFTTQTIVTIPNCTTLVSPSSGSTNVAINSDISWNAVSNATGYFISYGTNNAANNIENMVDVGNALSYNPPTNFPDQTQIYVVITPYNTLGNAIGCNLQYFDTETSIVEIPKVVLFTPSFFTPNGDGFNDIWEIEDPKNEVKTISIFDRFGKTLRSSSNQVNWDGTFNNQNLASDDYWFVIEKKTGELLKGHFTLKR